MAEANASQINFAYILIVYMCHWSNESLWPHKIYALRMLYVDSIKWTNERKMDV